jgi:hypothetical protein
VLQDARTAFDGEAIDIRQPLDPVRPLVSVRRRKDVGFSQHSRSAHDDGDMIVVRPDNRTA